MDIIKLLSFFIHSKPVKRWYNMSTHRFTKSPRYYRVTVGLNNLVNHGVYKNYTESEVVREDEIEAARERCKAIVIKKGEAFLGYPYSEWWCGEIGEETIQIDRPGLLQYT